MNSIDGYREFLLLEELSNNNPVTQRDLSKKFGLALGLVNSYLKNLISKGYITVSTIPKNRYKYFLTPKGISERTRLTYLHLYNFTNLYRVARRDFQYLFNHLCNNGVKRVVFCGLDEVTEIAYLSLQEVDMKLVAVADDENIGKRFFGEEIISLGDIKGLNHEITIITSFNRGDKIQQRLKDIGIDKKKVCNISEGGWLKKITIQYARKD
ncbi:MAG: winged helix-turn-helix transcriptional regulator [Deltaproteobacteria bacterium]|nr:winged helix-turn-helix transcriptional regulator [Deltaproteobacteria bacterium]